MIIRPIKENIEDVCLYAVLGAIFSLVMFYDGKGDKTGIIFAIIISCIVLLVVINFSIEAGRTFILDETGYTVRFLWIQKKYLWEELKVKTIFYYEFKWKRCTYVIGRVLFSPYKFRYNQLFTMLHPFSYLAIKISDEQKPLRLEAKFQGLDLFYYYYVDKTEFLEKMQNWSVELENTRKKYGRDTIKH